jgi:phosphomannomutase
LADASSCKPAQYEPPAASGAAACASNAPHAESNVAIASSAAATNTKRLIAFSPFICDRGTDSTDAIDSDQDPLEAMTRLAYFKAYDLRGSVPEEIDAGVAWRLGRALPGWAGAAEFVVGRDARLSSPALAEALIRGLVEAGARVRDMGMLTTPMLNFAVARRRCHGVMVTASHNPSQYNGFKIIDSQVEQVYYGRGLETLEPALAVPAPPAAAAGGSVLIDSILAEYCEQLAARFGPETFAPVSTLIDCANGVGALPLGVLERLGVRHTLLYHVPDGAFPNHGPDTLRPENLAALRAAVPAARADVGVMFDGDADRIAVVDERGMPVPPEGLLLVLAREELARRRGTVFYDLRMSRAVREEIEKLGGTPATMRVGNPFYKEALHRSQDGLLAAELSGHIMFAEHHGVDDALYAALKLLTVLARGGPPLSQRFAALGRYARSGEIRIGTREPQSLVAAARAHFAGARLHEVDGITVEYPDWWFNLRASNTEPVAKLVIEAASGAALAARRDEVMAVVGPPTSGLPRA